MDQFSKQNPFPQQTEFPGVLQNGRFWYWAEVLNHASISSRKIRNRSEHATTLVGYLIAILCFGGFLLGSVLFYGTQLFTPAFWSTPHVGLLLLWLGIFSMQFLYFRWTDAKSKLVKLTYQKNGAAVEFTRVPSLDAAGKKGNIGDVLSEDGRAAIEEAYELARQAGHADVLPIHLFAGSLSSPSVSMLFMRLGLTFDQIKDALRRRMSTIPKGETKLGIAAQTLITKALLVTLQNNRPSLTALELFEATYAEDEFLRELLYSVKVEQDDFENVVKWARMNDQLKERYLAFRKAASFKPTKNMNRAYTAVATPFLDRVSEDLTRAAVYGKLPMLVGRDVEMRELLRSIEGGRQSVVLVGPPGVGKQSIVFGLAERMVSEEVPDILKDKRLVRLDIPVIVSSQGGSGAEERLLVALQEIGVSGNIIIVIEDIDQLVGQSSGGVDLSSVLAGELDKGYTFVIATTTQQGFTNGVERSILNQKLQKIPVPEPERKDAILVLESKVNAIESKHHVIFTYEAIAGLVDLSLRYMHDQYLPEKAITLAEEVALDVAAKAQSEWTRVTKEDIAHIVSEKTRVPVTEVTQEEGAKLLELESRMHERMIGQEEAVKAVSSALRRARAELRAENRPIANFLFLGPTGVGKTELAKTTAEVYFGNEAAMLRFDMSEYQDKSSIYRLIGGTNEVGLLTEAVRKNPFSLLLLDELEKAHPDILNLFLQVMDDGRLTDGTGRTVDFTNVILIATSNAGTQFIQDSVAQGVSMEQIKTRLMEEELKQVYRPEFLNRFDGVMVFKPLSQEDVVAIAYLMMGKVADRLKSKGISFRASDEAIHELAQKGYDPKFGARPLRRVIQETVDNAIAEIMLKGEVARRDTLVLEPGGIVQVEKAAQL